MTPLNASNLQNETGERTFDAQVVLEADPERRAVKDGWRVEYVRAGTTSSTGSRVGVQSASIKKFTDEQVPSTTGTFFWRARCVKPGSTAGPWTNYVEGEPRAEAPSTAQTFPSSPDPALSIGNFSVVDDGSDIDYKVTHSPNSSVTDSEHSAEATFVGVDGRIAATDSESSPVSNTTTLTGTDTGAGDGAASSTDIHRVDLDLKDSSGNVIHTTHTRAPEII